jgi:hypothetical protein
MRSPRAATLLVALAVTALGAAAVACSSSSTTSAGETADGGVTYVLDGVYVASESGDVWRFHEGRYALDPELCPASAADADTLPEDVTIDDGCTETGSYAISADGATLTFTRDADGTSTTEAFQAQQSVRADVDAGAVSEIGGLVTTMGPLVSTTLLVTLVNVGGKLLTAAPCSGQTASAGSDTGAMVRLATDVGFSCLQSQLTLPAYSVPAAPDGGAYCTSFSQPGCTAANYYGRRGVPYVYDAFVSGGSQAECGFEYEPGASSASGGQGNPRWTPYIRDTSGYYEYGTPDRSTGSDVTLLCTVDGDGHLQMKIDGAAVMRSDSPTTRLESKQTFVPETTHAFRITSIAWPKTMTSDPTKLAALKKAGQYFPPYTCQPMNQLAVTYATSLACTSSAGEPSVPLVAGSGGNASWSPGANGLGYTLSPASLVSETRSGLSSTDTLFPGGG